MCDYRKHFCRSCDEFYYCDLQGWICPTVNGDENRNTCEWCELRGAVEMQREYDVCR